MPEVIMKKAILSSLLCISLFGADAQRIKIGGPAVGAGSFQGFAMDAGTDRVGTVFQVSESCTLDTLLFRLTSRTGTTDLRYYGTLEGVVTSGATAGDPDGTVATSGLWTAPNDTSLNNTIRAITVSPTVALTRGEFRSITLRPCISADAPCPANTTPDGTSNITVGRGIAAFTGWDRTGIPYSVNSTDSGSTWGVNAETAVFGYRCTNGKSYGLPLQSQSTEALQQGGEHGVKFALTSGLMTNFKVIGFKANFTTPSAGKLTDISLYQEGNDVPLQTFTWDSDTQRSTTTNVSVELYFNEATLATLTAGTNYRLAIAPQDFTNGISFNIMTFATAADAATMPGGSMFQFTYRSTNCGGPCKGTSTAWTDDPTQRPMVELILEEATCTGGSSSSSCSVTFVQ
jgi:hypothetical protein